MNAEQLATLTEQLGPPADIIPGSTEYYAWWQPVFDRELADCVYGNPKGSLSFQTLNRIEANTEYLQHVLGELNIRLQQPGVPRPAKWMRELYIRTWELNNIITSLNSLYATGLVDVDTSEILPQDPETLLTFGLINDMEKLLLDITYGIERFKNAWRYCGQYYAGGTFDDQYF